MIDPLNVQPLRVRQAQGTRKPPPAARLTPVSYTHRDVYKRQALAITLAERGITTMDGLAELSVDDLNEITGLDDKRAAQLIMKAREPWFLNGR